MSTTIKQAMALDSGHSFPEKNGLENRLTPNGLPDDWQVKPIREAYSFTKKPRGLSVADTGFVPFLPMDTIPIGRIKVIEFEERLGSALSSGTYIENGDLLVAKITPSFENGKQAIVDWTKPFGFATTEVIPIQEINGVSDKHFLFYLLLHPTIRSDLAGKMDGTTGRQRLSKNVLASRLIPFPPLPEQRKIAGVLGVVQQAIEQQERLIALTVELKKTLMQKLFTEGLRGELQKQTEIGLVPESWDLVPCEDLCEMITVGVVVKPASHYIEKGIPAFRSFNVQEDRLAPNNLVYFSENANDTALAKSKLRAGDVLVVRTGYPGTSCVVPKKYDGANCIDLVIVRPKAGVILSGFLSRFFNAPAGKDQAIAAKHGLAQQHLNVSAVKRTVVPVPSLEEQEEIDTALATVQQKIGLINAKKDTLATLFHTLLHHLMTAQLRVHDLDLDILECGDASPLSHTGTCPSTQSADASAHSTKKSAVVPAHSKRGRR